MEELRTNEWLQEYSHEFIAQYYPELIEANDIIIEFGRKSRTRLGSIKRRNNRSIITLTGYFRDPNIPEYVLDETLAHELAHYWHGFSSPLPKKYPHPHKNRVIHKELVKRGLSLQHRNSRRWLKTHWQNTVEVPAARPHRVRLRKPRIMISWW